MFILFELALIIFMVLLNYNNTARDHSKHLSNCLAATILAQ